MGVTAETAVMGVAAAPVTAAWRRRRRPAAAHKVPCNQRVRGQGLGEVRVSNFTFRRWNL